MSSPKQSVGERARLFGGLGLGLGLLGWFLSGLDWAMLGQALWTVRPGWIAAALLAFCVHYGAHSLRWGVLLKDLAPDLPPRLVWASTTVLFAFNTLLPLRAGNLLRPVVISAHPTIPFTAALFATVSEYICDTLGILVMLLLLTWMVPPDVIAQGGPVAEAAQWGRYLAMVGLVAFSMVLVLSSARSHASVQTLVAPIPSDRVREKTLQIFEHLVVGVSALRNPLLLAPALLLTAVVWGSWFVAIQCTLWAFGLDLPYVATVFLEAALTLSMLVPQAPGFLGVFQVVTEQSLALWHAPEAQSQGVALVFWFLCFGPITALGLFDGYRRGVA